jgi:hypothetical protein
MSMKIYPTTVTFAASATSSVINPSVRGPILAIRTEDAFAGTSISFLYCDTIDGTYVDVKNELGEVITVTDVNTTTGAIYDLTNIFPLGVGKMANANTGYLRLKANGSISETVTVYVGELA